MHKPGCQFPTGNSATKCQECGQKRLQIQELGTVYTAIAQQAGYPSLLCMELETEQGGSFLTFVL